MDVTTLGVKVKSDGIEKTNRDLDKLERNSKGASTATGKLANKFSALKGAVAALGIAAATRELVQVTSMFQDLESRLITATGSIDGANDAFKEMKQLAASTPYDVAQVVDSFIKLKNLGLDPSSEALMDYGNMASAMGKSLNQMIEAVADASTNEFERLKEFGIKAKQQGDQVTFTFQGVSTTIEKDSKQIVEYLRSLSEENFGDAMERQMDTMSGAVSNAGDAWDELVYTISESGIGSLIEGSIRKGTTFMRDLSDEIEGTTWAWKQFSEGNLNFFELMTMGADEAYAAKESISGMAISFEDLAEEMEKAKQKTQEMESATNSLNVGALSKSVSLIKQQVPALQDTIAAWDQHIATLRGKYSDTLSSIAQQEQGLMNIRRGNNDMIRELENRNLPATVRYYDKVRALEQQTAEASRMSGDAKVQELQRINQEWFNLSGAVRENGEEVISQEEATGRALSEIRANAEAMEEAKQAQIEASKEQLNTLATSISEAEKQVAQYRKELDGLQKQTAELAQTTQVNIDTGQATSAVQKLNAELQKLLQSMAQAEGTQYAQPPESGDFASGGYTGRGGVNQPAGIVHKGEVVFSQSDVARAGGVAAVESMRRSGDLPGYAGGGIVGYVGSQYNAIDQELQGYQTYDELITSDFSRRLQSFREHALRWYSAANQAQLMYAEQQYRGRMNELYNQQEAAQSITQNTGDQSTNYNVTVNSSANSGETLARELLPAIQKLQQRRITIE